MSDAMFRSGYEACRFAYAFSGQQYPLSVMAKLMRGLGLGSGRGLVGLEGAAVAGTVKRHVESLPKPLAYVIAARFQTERNKAVEHTAHIVQYVMPALGTGGHHRHMVRALVCKYFGIPDSDGRPVQLSALADQYGLSADTMTRRWRATKDRLREYESQSEGAIDSLLQEVGLID